MVPIYTYTYGCREFLLLLLDPNLQLIQPEEQASLLQGTPITEEGQFPPIPIGDTKEMVRFSQGHVVSSRRIRSKIHIL